MKVVSRILSITLTVMLIASLIGPFALADSVYGRAIMNISTRSGPSTRYKDTGTYMLKGQWL